MAILRPDEYRHTNPDLAIVDAAHVRGGRRQVADRAGLYALVGQADQLREQVTLVRVLSDELATPAGSASEQLLVSLVDVDKATGWQAYTPGGTAYDDSGLQDRVGHIESVVPSSASSSNKLVAKSDLGWYAVGDPTSQNYTTDPAFDTTQFTPSLPAAGIPAKLRFFGQVTGSVITNDLRTSNLFGFNAALNIAGSNSILDIYSCANLTIGSSCRNLLVRNASYVTIGNGCANVEVHDCSGTSAAPFQVPANTTNAVYRNNVLVGLYGFNMRGAWAASTAYNQYDAVAYNGATYYRSPAGTYTSGTAFDSTQWVGFGAGLYTTIDYLNEIRVGVDPGGTSPGVAAGAYALNGAGGKSYVLNGQTVEVYDTGGVAANAPLFGRLFAFRAIGTVASTLTRSANTSFTFGVTQATSVTLQPGEYIWLRARDNSGYDIVVDGRKTTGNGTGPTYTAGTGIAISAQNVISVADTYAVLPYAPSIALDFAAAAAQILALTGNVAFAASTNLAQGRTKRLFLSNTAAAATTLAFPSGWVFVGTVPTSLAAGKKAILSLEVATGNTEADVFAGYSAQA
jgi:hypothetical protein